MQLYSCNKLCLVSFFLLSLLQFLFFEVRIANWFSQIWFCMYFLLNIILQIGEILNKRSDIKVIYTRKTDVFVDTRQSTSCVLRPRPLMRKPSSVWHSRSRLAPGGTKHSRVQSQTRGSLSRDLQRSL